MNDKLRVGAPRAARPSAVDAPAGRPRRGPKPAERSRLLEPPLAPLDVDAIRALAGGEIREPRIPKLRFAPSPSGFLHIGNLRAALVNYLYAKKSGGEFHLRIEDTNPFTTRPDFIRAIFQTLQAIGIEWDGDVWYQSRRTALYREKAEKLLAEGKAFTDGTGAIFFKLPEDGLLSVNDRVKGRVFYSASTFKEKELVLIGADEQPKFLLANAVDDIEMGITHVIRGEEHLRNAALQNEIYRALGSEPPEWFHLGLIHGDDGHKLSKRHGSQSANDYLDQGYHPLVLINHLARLGMDFGTEETLTLRELGKRFDPLKFSRTKSMLGLERLNTRGRRYLRQMDSKALVAEIKSLIGGATVRVRGEDGAIVEEPNLLKELGDAAIEALADGARARASRSIQIIEIGQELRKPALYSEEDAEKFATPEVKVLMRKLAAELRKVPPEEWNLKTIDGLLARFNEVNNVGYTAYGNPLRWMLTGVPDGLPLHHTMVILGREESLGRLQDKSK